MIAVAEARKLIIEHCNPLPTASLPLGRATGLTLAENIFATHDFPPFQQAAMDGYAFSFAAWKSGPLHVSGTVQAGASQMPDLLPQQATRIFTGAPVPNGLDTVVMQEKVDVQNGILYINDDSLAPGINVRKQGAEIEKGDLALGTGTVLSAGAIGFLAGLGTTTVAAFPQPRVAILVTGKELQTPGKPLRFGQVYESNGAALTAALAQCGITTVTTTQVDDDPGLLAKEIDNALQNADLLLLTGGVSVGDYDFVAKALATCGVQTIFHKVRQRPGKPLLFGKKEETVVFGLPGNPSSVLTCFFEYVLPAIEQLMQLKSPFITTITLPMLADYEKNGRLTVFLKATHTHGGVLPLGAQESFKMRSFAVANCLIVVDESSTGYKKGDMAEVHLLHRFTG